MNSRKISLALATIAALSSGIALPSQAEPSPAKGVICSTGFKGESVGGGFRCFDDVSVLIENICTDSRFTKLTLMKGRDICTKPELNVAFDSDVTKLNKGKDYVDSVADPDAKKKAEERLERGFTTGILPLPTLAKKRKQVKLPILAVGQREVATLLKGKVLIDDAGDIDDHTLVIFRVFVFPVNRS